MTRFGSALESWDEAQADAPATLTAVTGGRKGERPAAARSLAEVRTFVWWSVLLCAGLAIWTGAIYGFMRVLTGPFN